MKRPSGFDGGAREERRPETSAGETTEPGGETRPSSASPGLLQSARWRFQRRTATETGRLAPDTEAAAAGDSRSHLGATPEAEGEQEPVSNAVSAAIQNSEEFATVPLDLGSESDALIATQARRGGTAADVGGVLERLRGLRASTDDPVKLAAKQLRQAERARKKQARSEQRRFSAPARRSRRVWIVALSAVGALIVFVLLGIVTPLMAVRDIQVTGTALVNSDDVASALQKFEGVPLALVNESEVHRALEPFPLIQRYAIERIPPHTLTIRIEERLPVLSIETDTGYELYDAAAVLLGVSEAPPEGVPVGTESVRDVTSTAFASAAQVLRDMPSELKQQITAASATSAQDLTFAMASGVQVIWGEAEHTQRKAVVLSAMLTALGEQPVTVIDVSSSEAPVFH